MRKHLSFRVHGIPRPAGSKRAFVLPGTNRAIVTDASKHAKTWKDDVKGAALWEAPDKPINAPIEMNVIFVMPRPKAHYRTGKFAGEVKPNAPDQHTKMPDATKLMRGTEDAMTGIIYADDNVIWKQVVEKRYGEVPGAIINIYWEDEEDE